MEIDRRAYPSNNSSLPHFPVEKPGLCCCHFMNLQLQNPNSVEKALTFPFRSLGMLIALLPALVFAQSGNCFIASPRVTTTPYISDEVHLFQTLLPI